MRAAGLALVLFVGSLAAAGCLGPNQLGGSVSEIFPLDVSQVVVLRNEQAFEVNYYVNDGPNIDLVIGFSMYVGDDNFRAGQSFPLQGTYDSDHERTTVVHQGAGEPVRFLGTVKRGTIELDQGGNPDQYTTGNFSLSFYEGDDLAAGHNLQGTFDQTALDAGFGPGP